MENLPKNWAVDVPLMDLANVYTGKKDANFAVENGKYNFFTCAFEPLKADSFSYEGRVLILPGNGVNVGEVFYYDGKFEAYQRTYIIDEIKVEPKYLFYHLKRYWRERGTSTQFGSATNYIKIGNFKDYSAEVPPPRRTTTHSSQVRRFIWAFRAGKKPFRENTRFIKELPPSHPYPSRNW